MKDFAADKIRNIALIGHGSSGKTSLAAAVLFDAGVTSRLTKVDKGNTVTDFEPEEIERKISISSAVCFVEWKDHKINIVDTPGLHQLPLGHPGRPAGRRRRRRPGRRRGRRRGRHGEGLGDARGVRLPRLIVINKMDRENANFGRAVESVQQFFGRQAVPVQIPIGEEKNFRGVVDLIGQKAYLFEKDESGKFSEAPVPAEVKDEADKRCRELVEMIAESDEKLMEKYLESGELSPDEVRDGPEEGRPGPPDLSRLRRLGAAQHRRPAPPRRDHRPAALARSTAARSPAVDQRQGRRRSKPSADAPVRRPRLQDAFRPLHRPHHPDAGLLGQDEPRRDRRPTRPRRPTRSWAACSSSRARSRSRPARPRPATSWPRPSSRSPSTGDTLSAKGSGIAIPPIKFPEPSISFAIEPKTRADEDKICQASHRIMEEDPTVRFERDPDTRPAPHLGRRRAPRPDHHRKAEEALQRRRRPQAAQDLLQGDDQGPGRRPGPAQEADRRPRPVRRRLDQDGAAAARQGLRVRGQDLRRGHPAQLHPLGRERHPSRPARRASWPATRSSTSRSSSTTGPTTTSIRRTSPSRSPPPRPSSWPCSRPSRPSSSRS